MGGEEVALSGGEGERRERDGETVVEQHRVWFGGICENERCEVRLNEVCLDAALFLSLETAVQR